MSEKKDSVRFTVASAADLIEGLESDDVGLHLAMLKAVAADPGRALAFGSHAGRDLIDVLTKLFRRASTSHHQRFLLITLSTFDDARVVEECKRIFAVSDAQPTREVAAARLARESDEIVTKFFRPWLFDKNGPAAIRLAAHALQGCNGLSWAEQVRRACAWKEKGDEDPPFSEATAGAWHLELSGPFDHEARQRLEGLGVDAFVSLKDRWEEISEESKIWLLEWGAREHELEVLDTFKNVLKTADGELLGNALRLMPALTASAILTQHLERLAQHPEPSIVVAAIRAGLRGLNWRRLIAESPASELRIAAVAALSEEEGERALPDITPLLEDGSWQMRAAAADALIRIGKPAVDAVRRLAAHDHQDTRLAATKVLLTLGEEEWLESNLVG